jgi:hypothetical protein
MKARPLFQILLGCLLFVTSPLFSGAGLAKKNAQSSKKEYKTSEEVHTKVQEHLVLAKASFAKESLKTSAIPASRCSATNPISAQTVISTPGHYCVTNDIITIGSAITITSSNVELSIDTHFIESFGDPTILILGGSTPISNIRIGGLGEISGLFSIGIINAQDVIIEDSFIKSFISGIFVENCQGLVVKNCSITSFDTGFAIVTESEDIHICSCGFFDSPLHIENGAPFQDLRIDDCFFDGSDSGIVLNTGERFSLNNSFVSNSNQALSLQNIDEISIQNTLIDSLGTSVILEADTNVSITDSLFRNVGGTSVVSLTNVNNMEMESCQLFGNGCSGIQGNTVTNTTVRECTVAVTAGSAQTGMNFVGSKGVQVQDTEVSVLLQDPETSGTNGVVFQDCVGFSLAHTVVETNARSTASMGGNGVLIFGSCQGGDVQDCIVKSIQPNVAAFGISCFSPSEAIRIENNTIDGARTTGIYLQGVLYSLVQNNLVRGTQAGTGIVLNGAAGIALFANTSIDNSIDGILLDTSTIQCAVRDNTTSKNGAIGINNQAPLQTNKIYHNFAQKNRIRNYAGVELVAKPGEGIGALENISGSS